MVGLPIGLVLGLLEQIMLSNDTESRFRDSLGHFVSIVYFLILVVSYCGLIDKLASP